MPKLSRFSLPPDFIPFAGVVLTRVSTPGQADDGLSLQTQAERGRDTLALLSIPCVDVLEDAGVAGDLYYRPALQEALAGLRAGRFNVVVVNDTSRLSWSTEHLPRILREIHAAGGRVFLISFGEFIDPDNHDQEFAIGVLNQADKRYRAHLRAESIKGKRTAARQGRQPYRNRVPFGYRVVMKRDILTGRDAPGTEGTYVVMPEAAETVRRIFVWYAQEGLTLRRVSDRLAEQGIKTPRGAPLWSPNTITDLLGNPVYYGEARSHHLKRVKDESRIGQPGARGIPYRTAVTIVKAPESTHIAIPAPALVSRDLWEMAQERLEENRRLANGPASRKHLLSGLVRCPFCGQGLSIRKGGAEGTGRKSTYRCARCLKERDVRTCYAEPRLERLVADAVQVLGTRPESIRATLEAWIAERTTNPQTGPMEAEVERLTRAVDRIEMRRDALLGMETDEPDFIAQGLQSLSREWKELRDRLGVARRRLEAILSPVVTVGAIDPEEVSRQIALRMSRIGEAILHPALPLIERRQALVEYVASIVPDVPDTIENTENTENTEKARGGSDSKTGRHRATPFAGVTVTTRSFFVDTVACVSIHITESSFSCRIVGNLGIISPIVPGSKPLPATPYPVPTEDREEVSAGA